MSMKYELTDEAKVVFGHVLHRIKALINIPTMGVKAGDLGGWIETQSNLSQHDGAWVYGDARVFGNAQVSGDARVYDSVWVYDNAQVSGDARVYDNVRVFDNAQVSGDARVFDSVWVYDNAQVSGDVKVYGGAQVCGDALAHRQTDLLTINPIGSRNDAVTFAKDKSGGITVAVGCFSGNIDEFAAAVKRYHGDNVHAKSYELAIELAKLRMGEMPEGEE